MKPLFRICTALLAYSLLVGCTGTIAQFSMVSNREVDVAALAGQVPHRQVVEGESSRLTQFIIFPTAMYPSIEEAVNEALDKGEGDLLINARVEQEIVWIPYLISVETITVKGTVVNTRAGKRR